MRTTERIAPPALVPFDAPLGVTSLVILEGPPALRMRRFRLDLRRPAPMLVPARGFMTIGEGEADIPIPGLVPFDLIENLDGDFVCTAAHARYSPRASAGQPLPPYATFEIAPYLFMVVPPTPDGLGIPPDYPLLTVPKAHPVAEPSLLVKAGYQRIVGQKFVLFTDRIVIGGALGVEVPLFRLRSGSAVRLVRGVGDLSYFVERLDPSVRVDVLGPLGDRSILTPFASLLVGDWELSLLPPPRRS